MADDTVTTSARHTAYVPQGDAKAAVVIAPAMGVRQDFYNAFAEFLLSHGVLVVTLDYRCMGFDEPADLRRASVTFDDWLDDIDAAIEDARARAPQAPLFLCGHSLGGQIMGMLRNRGEIAGALTVASGTGYWRHNRRMTLALLYLWFVAIPLYTRLFGYFPGRRLNKVGNLPRNIAITWARWCRHPRYLMADDATRRQAGYDQLRVPILCLSFTDDSYIPKVAIDQLHGFYRNARVEHHHVSPNDVGAKAIGHFGFFRLNRDHPLWHQGAQWLLQQAKAGRV